MDINVNAAKSFNILASSSVLQNYFDDKQNYFKSN